jgi:plasmid stabilization system protein ParE
VPKMRIRFHPAAAAEVDAAVRWYTDRSPVAARAFAEEVNVWSMGSGHDKALIYLDKG